MQADPRHALPDGPRLAAAETTFRWLARPFALLDDCAEQFGDRFTLEFTRFGTHVVVSHPDDVRAVFTGDPAVLRAGRGNALLEPILGRHSLLLAEGAAHLASRARLLPAFRADQVATYASLVAAATRARTAAWREGDVVSVQRTALAISREVILRAVLGIDAGAVEPLVDLVERLMALTGTNAPLDGGGDPRLTARLAASRAALVEALHRVVEERRRCDPQGDDVLSLLIRARDADGRPLADEEIHDQLVTMILAGHETSASAIGWAVLAVLGDRRVAARVLHELDAAGDAVPHAGALPYLQAICLETLRLYPVVPVVSRELAAPFALRDRLLPAGIFVTPCAYLAHRRPDAFPDPTAFRPERFLDRRHPPPHVFFPFGGGVRRCLGTGFALLEMRIVLGILLRGFRFRPVDARPATPIRRAVTIVPSGGVRMQVEPRAAAA